MTQTPALTRVDLTSDTVTFTAARSPFAPLTLPRPVRTQLGIPLPRAAGEPVHLTVTGRGRTYSYFIYPETPAGAACLAIVDPDSQVRPPDATDLQPSPDT